MRLLVVSHAADRTGAPISALQLCRAWSAMGIELRIVLRRGGPLAERYAAIAPTEVFRSEPHFSISDLPGQCGRSSLLLAAKCLRNPDRPFCLANDEAGHVSSLATELAAWKPDAIYANTSHCGDVLAALDLSAPVLTHVRELAPTLHALDRERQTVFLSASNAFLAVSEHARSDLLAVASALGHVLEPERVAVEPPAIEMPDLDTLDAQAPALLDTLGLPPDARIVCGAGTVGPRKGVDVFDTAARQLLSRDDFPADIYFVWFGTGEWRDRLHSAAGECQGRLIYAGERRDALTLFRRSSLLACPSREDAYPRVQIEAGLVGTPSLGFDGVGGGSEFIRDYQAGHSLSALTDQALAAGIAQFFDKRWTIPAGLSARVQAGRTSTASAERIVRHIHTRLEV